MISAYIYRCSQCGGTNWGEVAPPVTETLSNGEVVQTEQWGCVYCHMKKEADQIVTGPHRDCIED